MKRLKKKKSSVFSWRSPKVEKFPEEATLTSVSAQCWSRDQNTAVMTFYGKTEDAAAGVKQEEDEGEKGIREDTWQVGVGGRARLFWKLRGSSAPPVPCRGRCSKHVGH